MMKRIQYYPSIDEIIHLADNYNVNVHTDNGDTASLFPTDDAAALECTLMDLSSTPNGNSCYGGDKVDLGIWAYQMRNKPWMNYTEDQFITFHE